RDVSKSRPDRQDVVSELLAQELSTPVLAPRDKADPFQQVDCSLKLADRYGFLLCVFESRRDELASRLPDSCLRSRSEGSERLRDESEEFPKWVSECRRFRSLFRQSPD